MRKNSGETFIVKKDQVKTETHVSSKEGNVYESGRIDKNNSVGQHSQKAQKNRETISRLILLIAIGFLYTLTHSTPCLNICDRLSSLKPSKIPFKTLSLSCGSSELYIFRFSSLSVEKSNTLSSISSGVMDFCSLLIANSFDRKAVDKSGGCTPIGGLIPISLINGFSIQTLFTPERGITRLSRLFGGYSATRNKLNLTTKCLFSNLRTQNETIL